MSNAIRDMDPLVPWKGMTEAEATEMIEEHNRRQAAAQDAKRDASFGRRHVLMPPKRQPKMSGPRYFNFMRAMEADPEGYADYHPTTLCGSERTTEDIDLQSAKAKKYRHLLAEWGLCPECIAGIAERFPA